MSRIPSYYQDDSEGKFKGVDFVNIQIIVIAGLASLGIFLAVWIKSSVMMALVCSSLLMVPVLAWIFLLRHDKPAANDIDFFESLMKRDWEYEKPKTQSNPFSQQEVPK